MSVNKVILVGRVGNDPEIKHLEGGRAVATFSLATSETYKNREGKKITNTEWHNIVLWGGLAGVVEKYVNKGDQLYVEGKITQRSWDDKEGVKKYRTEINAREMTMLGSGKKKEDKPAETKEDSLPETKQEEPGEDLPSSDADDDLPF